MTTLTTSDAPRTARATSESAKLVERPNTIVAAPKTMTVRKRAGPIRRRKRIAGEKIDVASARRPGPSAGVRARAAPRRECRARKRAGARWRRRAAPRTGRADIVPSSTRLLQMKATPEKPLSSVRGLDRAWSPSAPDDAGAHAATNEERGRGDVAASGLCADRNPPSAGPRSEPSDSPRTSHAMARAMSGPGPRRRTPAPSWRGLSNAPGGADQRDDGEDRRIALPAGHGRGHEREAAAASTSWHTTAMRRRSQRSATCPTKSVSKTIGQELRQADQPEIERADRSTRRAASHRDASM